MVLNGEHSQGKTPLMEQWPYLHLLSPLLLSAIQLYFHFSLIVRNAVMSYCNKFLPIFVIVF